MEDLLTVRQNAMRRGAAAFLWTLEADVLGLPCIGER